MLSFFGKLNQATSLFKNIRLKIHLSKKVLLISLILIVIICAILIVGIYIGSRISQAKPDIKGVGDIKNIVAASPTPASSSATLTITPSPSPNPTSAPTIDCVGPDGKHMNITQKACDDFNNAWKPTSTPIPTTPPAQDPQATDTPTPSPNPTATPAPVTPTTQIPTENPTSEPPTPT